MQELLGCHSYEKFCDRGDITLKIDKNLCFQTINIYVLLLHTNENRNLKRHNAIMKITDSNSITYSIVDINIYLHYKQA